MVRWSCLSTGLLSRCPTIANHSLWVAYKLEKAAAILSGQAAQHQPGRFAMVRTCCWISYTSVSMVCCGATRARNRVTRLATSKKLRVASRSCRQGQPMSREQATGPLAWPPHKFSSLQPVLDTPTGLHRGWQLPVCYASGGQKARPNPRSVCPPGIYMQQPTAFKHPSCP